MTLSDRRIARLLRRHFVCGSLDTEGDPLAGASFAHEPGDPPGLCLRGNGEHNVQTLLLTPGGRLLSVMAGYVGPDDFAEELELALGLLARVERARPAAARSVVAEGHRSFLEKLGREEGREHRSGRRSPGALALLASLGRSRVRSDHRFAARHALMPAARFRVEELVGNARTFFGSTTNGARGGRIGDWEALHGRPAGEARGGSTGRRSTSRPTRVWL